MNHVALGEVCEINPRKSKTLEQDSYCSFIPMEHVDDQSGSILKTTVRKVKEVEKGYTFFENNDVIFAKITPCMENGKCAIARGLTNGIGFGSTEFHVLRSKTAIIPEWIYYFLRQESVRQDAARHMTGSAGQQRVPTQFLKEVYIPLPLLDEQRRLAALLERADRLRRLRRYARELGDQYLQQVFLEMFGDPVENPKRWEIKKLGDLILGFEGGVNFPPISEGEKASPWRVLKISAVTWGEFNPEESKPISPDVQFNKTLIVKKGDLIMSRANTSELVASVCMVNQIPPKVLLPDKLWRISFPENPKVLPEFILWTLRQAGIRKLIESLATGSSGSMKNISKAKAETIPVLLPPLSLQQRFAEIVRRYERVRAQQVEAERQTEQLFQSLLREAFGDVARE